MNSEEFRQLVQDYNLEWYSNDDPFSIKKAVEVTIDLVWEQIENKIKETKKDLESYSDAAEWWLLMGKLQALKELNDLVKKW